MGYAVFLDQIELSESLFRSSPLATSAKNRDRIFTRSEVEGWQNWALPPWRTTRSPAPPMSAPERHAAVIGLTVGRCLV